MAQSLISPSTATTLLDELETMLQAGGHPRSAAPRLTGRKLQVLTLVVRESNSDTAVEVFISDNTVKNHARNIVKKSRPTHGSPSSATPTRSGSWRPLQLHSGMEAVMYAIRENLLDLP